jgi:hypothetical protein
MRFDGVSSSAALVVAACACSSGSSGTPSSDPESTSASSETSGGTESAGGAAASAAAGPSSGGAGPAGGTSNASAASTGGNASNGSSVGTGGNGGGSAGARTGSDGPVDCYADGDGLTTIAFVNRCDEALTFRGSDIDGGDVEPGEFVCRDVGDDITTLSAKRYWAFIGSDPGGEHHTLAEFTFNTDFYDFDWYNISHVDAHNLPMQIVPVARPDCQTLTCAEDFLSNCGKLVACVSPERDNPNSPVAQYFEACDDAYAWSGDDQMGDDPSPVRSCAGEDWEIVFCPEAE